MRYFIQINIRFRGLFGNKIYALRDNGFCRVIIEGQTIPFADKCKWVPILDGPWYSERGRDLKIPTFDELIKSPNLIPPLLFREIDIDKFLACHFLELL